MKIFCDVCNKEEANVFCAADEAALCSCCDQRVHHANKLAGKHVRFSLVNPSLKESPLCDICQERRAFLFYQEDRAILCEECDIPIHNSNQHTKKHNRFLLTGVRLSSSSSTSSYVSSCAASSSSNDSEIKPSFPNQFSSYTISSHQNDQNQYYNTNNLQDQSSMSTSSISEYLMETLPGWRVDDFLDPSSHGFCKINDVQSLVLDHVSDTNSYVSFENSGIWVPRATSRPSRDEHKMPKFSRKWLGDGLKVPQSSPSLMKSRNFS